MGGSGLIIGLQMQVDELKRGTKPHRWYDTSRIRPVGWLAVTARGAASDIDGQRMLDVHHADHPRSHHRNQANGLSVMFTSHYLALRERFGTDVADGVAGENVLVRADRRLSAPELRGAVLSTAEGVDVTVTDVEVVEPCVEFSRFVTGQSATEAGGLKEPLQELRGGMRGFCLALSGPVTLRRGDVLQLPS